MGTNLRTALLACSLACLLPRSATSAEALPADEIAKRLRATAARLASSPASELFAELESKRATLHLSDEQARLCSRLDRLLRTILASGMLRGLDGGPLPPRPALEELLSERGDRERETVVAHAEAIVLRAVLEREQAERLRKGLHRKGGLPTAANRYGPFRWPGNLDVNSVDQYEGLLKREMGTLNTGYISYLFKCAFDNEECVRLLAPRQPGLARELEKLTRDILRPWFEQGLLSARPPADNWEAAGLYDSRYRPWDRRRNDVVAHAEFILVHGVLSPAQAEALLKSYWKTYRTIALLDPDLASRLKLGRGQRLLLVDRVDEFEQVQEDVTAALGGMIENAGGQKDEAGRDLGVLASRERERLLADAQAGIVEVLTPAQLKYLRGLIGPEILPQPPADARGGVDAKARDQDANQKLPRRSRARRRGIDS